MGTSKQVKDERQLGCSLEGAGILPVHCGQENLSAAISTRSASLVFFFSHGYWVLSMIWLCTAVSASILEVRLGHITLATNDCDKEPSISEKKTNALKYSGTVFKKTLKLMLLKLKYENSFYCVI